MTTPLSTDSDVAAAITRLAAVLEVKLGRIEELLDRLDSNLATTSEMANQRLENIQLAIDHQTTRAVP